MFREVLAFIYLSGCVVAFILVLYELGRLEKERKEIEEGTAIVAVMMSWFFVFMTAESYLNKKKNQK